MAQLVWILWGKNKTRDYQFAQSLSAALEQWVVNWLEVTIDNIAAWVAIIEVARTWSVTFKVPYYNTESVNLTTLINKKIFIEIEQINIDEWDTNNDAAGDNIWSIKVADSFPTKNYIPLAETDGAGVVTDLRSPVKLMIANTSWNKAFIEAMGNWSIDIVDENGVLGDVNVSDILINWVWTDQALWIPLLNIDWKIKSSQIDSPWVENTKSSWIYWEVIIVWESLCVVNSDFTIKQLTWVTIGSVNNIVWNTFTSSIWVTQEITKVTASLRNDWWGASTAWCRIYDSHLWNLLWTSITANIPSSTQSYIDFIFSTPISIPNNTSWLYFEIFEITWQTQYEYNTSDVYVWWQRIDNNAPVTWDLNFSITIVDTGVENKFFKTDATNQNRLWFKWYANVSWGIGEPWEINTAWVDTNQSWLMSWVAQYLSDVPWKISSTPWTNSVKVGVSISETEVSIETNWNNDLDWESTVSAVTWWVVLWNAEGYITIKINWVDKKIPYYWS